MFTVKTPDEVYDILRSAFPRKTGIERLPLAACSGRVLAETVTASEYVPGFRRSTVDGYAVMAADTFGCSDSIPALLVMDGEILMGQESDQICLPGHCVYVPTGGAVPEGADAVVMIEYTENFGDGTIAVEKPVSPGTNLILKGDDVFPGKTILTAGRKLTPADLGALAAMGITEVPVRRQPVAGILSTGDELVPVSAIPGAGQIRDVNSTMLDALCRDAGAVTRRYGIVRDETEALKEALDTALEECDLVLISGGSSVGTKDATAKVIAASGELLIHGIAIKPGKPTILGSVKGKPVFGLPGHPVAAFFITMLFVKQLLASFTGRSTENRTAEAVLTEAVSTNHGRSECLGVRLHRSTGDDPSGQAQAALFAEPIRTKSGLISALAGSDGYITIPRDCEGLAAGTTVHVTFYTID